jgi:DNA/RNA-binding domain of Phe-tRNA-synthetase-like protein
MMGYIYTVHPEIFEMYPGYVRGVVLAQDVQNGASSTELIQMLRQAEEYVRSCLFIDTVTEEERIACWREAYRKFGAKPSEFRSSVEAMVRRCLRNEPLPTINTLVDIGNIVSLRRLMPVGGHAIDQLTGDITLRLATGKEEFIPFGSNEMEHPDPGEVIFAEGNTVLTRRWTWRQGNHTLTLQETTAVEYNLDGLPPIGEAEVKKACDEVVELVQRFCQGRFRVQMLTVEHPSFSLTG